MQATKTKSVPTVEKEPSPKILPKLKSSFLRDCEGLMIDVFGWALASPPQSSILRQWGRLELSWVLTIDEEAQEHNTTLGWIGAASY